MRIKFDYTMGNTVSTCKSGDVSFEEIISLLIDPRVIRISVVKQTPAQYLKSQSSKAKTGEGGI